MHYAPITVGEIEHDCNGQSYQYNKPKTHGFDKLAEDIRAMDEPFKMKKPTINITTTQEWKDEAPDKLWDLILKKCNEYPGLLEGLISTAPYLLIEASTDLHSEKYDEVTYLGSNDFGKMS